jgi:hypothetical protein
MTDPGADTEAADPDANDAETLTFTIEADGEREDVTVPRGMIELLAEDGDGAAAATVAGDIVLLSCTQRANAIVHNAEGEVTEELLAIEARSNELFEARFGTTFEAATSRGRPSG